MWSPKIVEPNANKTKAQLESYKHTTWGRLSIFIHEIYTQKKSVLEFMYSNIHNSFKLISNLNLTEKPLARTTFYTVDLSLELN